MLKMTSPILSIGATVGGGTYALDMGKCIYPGCDQDARPRQGTRGRFTIRCAEHHIENTKAVNQTTQRNRGVAPRGDVPCRHCGTAFTQRAHTHIYCSKRCMEIAAGTRRSEPLPDKTCELPECGITFTPSHTWQRCCTSLHGHRLYNRESRADGRQKAVWNDRKRDVYHRRRALKRAGTTAGQPVRMADIAARAHWKCGICHKKVNPKLTYPNQMSASIDHILPLNAGGQHDPSNTRLVHLLCNTRRSDRYNGDSIMLFG